jgi:hypothetical protein
MSYILDITVATEHNHLPGTQKRRKKLRERLQQYKGIRVGGAEIAPSFNQFATEANDEDNH